ncbi:MAG: hypothetical protein HY028_06215 [Gammaproteobacteria bacterium]|nr:hypothetical protein [Gammaproteobacteria bacterium]
MPINSVTTLTQYFKTFCVGKPHPAESWSHSRRASPFPYQLLPNMALNRTLRDEAAQRRLALRWASVKTGYRHRMPDKCKTTHLQRRKRCIRELVTEVSS